MITIKFIGELDKKITCQYMSGKSIMKFLNDIGVDQSKYMAIIVDGRITDPNQPIKDGITIHMIPPIYGG